MLKSWEVYLSLQWQYVSFPEPRLCAAATEPHQGLLSLLSFLRCNFSFPFFCLVLSDAGLSLLSHSFFEAFLYFIELLTYYILFSLLLYLLPEQSPRFTDGKWISISLKKLTLLFIYLCVYTYTSVRTMMPCGWCLQRAGLKGSKSLSICDEAWTWVLCMSNKSS